MRSRHNPAVKIAFLCLAVIFAFPLIRADELSWNNTDGSNYWTGTDANLNWVLTGTDLPRAFNSGNAVIFGDINPAASSTITISSSTGVTLGASGTNPGMVVTGTGNWEFVLAYTTSTTSATTTTTGTSHAGIGISGSDAGVRMAGTGTLTFSMTTGYTGATQVDAGTLRLNVANAIAQSSGVTLAAAAKLDLAGHDQTLKALAVSSGANIVFSSTGANYNKLTLGALTGDGGVFDLRVNVGSDKGDQIILSGSSEGAHGLRFTHYGDTEPHDDTSILVVTSVTGSGATFSGTTDAGTYKYQVERGADGSWYLNNSTQLSRIASAVIASAATAGQDWHYELDALYKRMGELREPPLGASGDLWFRANASRVNVDENLTGYAFHENTYGAMLGADKAFHSGGSTWIFGAFGAMSRVDRDFNDGGDGKTKSTGGGLYVTWVYETGWFADLIGRMDRNKNDISAISTDGYLATADYDNKVKGLSFEFGRRLFWNEEWWIEPAVQYAVADIGGVNYQAFAENQSPLDVQVQKSRASQARASLRIGEAGGSNPGWHPYAKLAFVYSSTRDGRVSANGRDFTADFDGWRWEIGIGAAYVINARSQFYYDYEYAHATRYKRPWSVNVGYRYAW